LDILRIEGVTKRYAQHTALQDVSFSIPEKSIFGLLGPNGAGKTSLIRIITQITGPDAGRILFKEQPLRPEHIRNIGYLPEERGLYKKMKVGEQLLYLAQLKGLTKDDARARIKRWIDKFEIRGWLDKHIEDLSKGMQQKVQFIATVMHEPELIILDEPFSGFDPINANLIKDEILALRDQGSTIIFSTHRMESVEELCDNIALINGSRVILNGSVKEIKESFRTHTFRVSGKVKGRLLLAHPDFVVLRQDNVENEYFMDVRLENDARPNDLLRYLIERAEVQKFEELIPSVNDIFIRKVTETGGTVPVEA
jgi:ABC-2 type transport system ATP-binding protein